MEIEQNDYIQTIIDMKMRCAESEMKAAESQHLYSQLKKKYASKWFFLFFQMSVK